MEPTDTRPKPFVFVLMPFAAEFDNIYEVGIKDAATTVGAYAERVSEQKYAKPIVEQIYHQIKEANVIVADMTGKNANVFYEVGFAHALEKIVILLTRDINDIPFDLKDKYHIKYDKDRISALRAELMGWLSWAIPESEKEKARRGIERCKIEIGGVPVPENRLLADSIPVVEYSTSRDASFAGPAPEEKVEINVRVQNASEAFQIITYAFLFSARGKRITPTVKEEPISEPERIEPHLNNNSPVELNGRHHLDIKLPPVSPGRKEEFKLKFGLPYDSRASRIEVEEVFALKMWVGDVDDPLLFPFRLKVNIELNRPRLSAPFTLPSR